MGIGFRGINVDELLVMIGLTMWRNGDIVRQQNTHLSDSQLVELYYALSLAQALFDKVGVEGLQVCQTD